MVRIINGEIVQDNDPRLRRGAPTQLPDPRRTPQAPSSGTPQPPPRQAESNVIEAVARYLKIENRFITIPAMPALRLTESRVGLVYFLLVGLLTMLLGYKAILFAVVMFIVWKHSEHTTRTS